jgi:hypothetical protein
MPVTINPYAQIPELYSYNISYLSKDGTNKKADVVGHDLEHAKQLITDLVSINYWVKEYIG